MPELTPENQQQKPQRAPLLGADATESSDADAAPAFDEQKAIDKLLSPAAAIDLPSADGGEDEAAPATTSSHTKVVPTVSGPITITPLKPIDTAASPLVNDRGVTMTSVSLRRGRATVLHDLTFAAAAGNITALIGPNGSGKTATAAAVAGLVRPAEGEIRVCGIDPVSSHRDVVSSIGWVPEKPPFWVGATVRSMIETTGRLWHFDRDDARARADVLLELTGLTELADFSADQLNSSHARCLSLACALVHDPQVVICDCTLEDLDPAQRRAIGVLLRSLASEGKAVIVTVRTPGDALAWADRCNFLVDGTIATSEQVVATQQVARAWQLRSSSPVALFEALRELRLPFTANEPTQSVEVVLENEAAAGMLITKLDGVPIVEYRPARTNAEHILAVLTHRAEREQQA